MYILMVEDEPRVADFVRRGLRAEGWVIDYATNAEDALILLRDAAYDIVLLDMMLPGMSGKELCRHLRASRNDVPILMLSALGSTEDRVNGLRAGADDYLPKPFDFDELIARIESLHRRMTRSTAPEPDRVLRVGPLSFDAASMRLMLDETEVICPPRNAMCWFC